MGERFTVDTHLFRELGELLVGRDSTALVELIKNAYDADATKVVIHGSNLDRPENGRIVVADNGTGMTQSDFRDGFLRVASRLKEQGTRRSSRYLRRYTGAKGIGRLAAHKLARQLVVDSTSAGNGRNSSKTRVYAKIDWDVVEACETLDEIAGSEAITTDSSPASNSSSLGTTLTLTKLRRKWTPSELARFFVEVQSSHPPAFFTAPLPIGVIREPLLFEEPLVRDESSTTAPPPFEISLEGEFEAGDSYWDVIAQQANWVLEIRADDKEQRVDIAVAPTLRTVADFPLAAPLKTSVPYPDSDPPPAFDARILVREGQSSRRLPERSWMQRSSGVRIYMEGFRVLPYGGLGDDWLQIDADYVRRSRDYTLLDEFFTLDSLPQIEFDDPNEALTVLPGSNFFGAVFLTQDRSPHLRTLVNREGFVPDESFVQLSRLVKLSIQLLIRTRAATTYTKRLERRAIRQSRPRRAGTEVPGICASEDGEPRIQRIPDRIDSAVGMIRDARRLVSSGSPEAELKVDAVVEELKELKEEFISEQSLLRVLASVGTQMASFIHEINALLGVAQAVERALAKLIGDTAVGTRSRLKRTLTSMQELRRGLERQASYLVDVVTPDARRRRSRQRLAERFDAALMLVARQADARGIQVMNNIPDTLRSPPMFRAELTTLFANLLTNAVKAAGTSGRILVRASERPESMQLRIENTGNRVRLSEAEKWFLPFQSTTNEVDPVLGQGMGLGLTITRSMLDSYGATIKFVPPSRGYATAIEIDFPK